MILTTEQLRQRAHELALTHDLHLRRRESRKLQKSVVSDVNQLSTFIDNLRRRPTSCSQPAEDWLLDHAEFLEEQALIVKDQLAEHYVYALPSLRRSGELRILSLCDDYMTQMDGSLEEKSLIAYINYYQEVSILTIAEVWAVPLIIRLSLFRNLAKAMATIQERRDICIQVEQWLTKFEPSKLSPEVLKLALEEAGHDIPLSGPLIVHLVSHLREWADDTAVIRDWLMCKLDNGQESLDRIVAYEYELQASYQMRTGNLIGSMRSISRFDWRIQFEQLSLIEQTLRQDPTGDYALLDYSSRDTLRKRVEQLARRLHVPENLIANQVVTLAINHIEQTQQHNLIDGTLSRQAYIPYYLLEAKGIQQLQRELKSCSKPRSIPEEGIWRRATGTYFNLLVLSYVVILLGFIVWISTGVHVTPLDLLLMVILLSFPAIEWATTWMHGLIEWRRQPTPLLRYDFSNGITAEATTMVVIPVIWSSSQEVRELADRLEQHYLVSRDPNIHFALLGDYKDSDTAQRPEDQVVLEAARASIEKLNSIYPGNVFHLYHRRRLWNLSEGKWMGWERKRGKLVEFIQLLMGKKDTSYDYSISDNSDLARIRYMITLDADTQLPPGSPQRMIGTMHLPYNRPRMNRARTRVIEGYGILQPRIAMSYEAANHSRLANLWSGDTGVDPYSFAVSDPYQDGMGQGIFTGKGIFDVHTFANLLCDRIPDNRVLSHDLLEGGFLRTGLLSDIELIDGHPALFSTYQMRLHRWIRGDWQLLLWLLPRVCNQQGDLLPIDLSILTRWQIIDNLRRSLLPVMTFIVLFLAFTVLPGSPERWLGVVLVTWLFPVLRQMMTVRRMKLIGITAGQVLVQVITLPYHTVMSLDAVIRTLYRLFVSKQRLLQWVSSAEIEHSSKRERQPLLLGMYSGLALTILFTVASVIQDDLYIRSAGLILGMLWACAPIVIRWLNQPMNVQSELVLGLDEYEKLRKLSRDIWSFFEVYVTAEDHFLPPDNVQLAPPKGVAHRTSPTNIGLYLTCVLAARDFEFIDTPELIERLECTISSIESLAKWEGHLLNWYDTKTLQPLLPQYVSTVDSGNLVACLMTVREGLREWLLTDSDSESHPLIARLEALIQGTDFRPLYDHSVSLLSLGYNVGRHERDTIVYDLMASEARHASFIAIALGQVSVSHWHVLGRTMTKIGQYAALLSWSGTMFEYLMPWLFMRTYRNSIWDSTYRAVVQRQIEYAHDRGVPFGISESGYYAFDYQMNYQYQAFGVPGLGFKRGLEQDLVVAPYATIMALPYAQQQGLMNLDRLEKLGARGEYGYYEAIDYTLTRMPNNQERSIIMSFMAHHQGMSLLTLANILLPHKMFNRFHNNKYVRSVELLLQERIPLNPRILERPIKLQVHKPETNPIHVGGFREYLTPTTMTPEACILSNGAYMTVISVSGGGFSQYEGKAISRWQEDPVMDQWGSYIYIRDLTHDKVWSPTYHPCRVQSTEQYIRFSLDSALFTRVDGDIRTKLEICVSPEANVEVRRLTLTNTGIETRIIEVTTFQELALAHPVADDAHPAFSKLFVRTQFEEDSECLVAGRRPREVTGKPIWAAHSLIVEGRTIGAVEYETDRSRFIGRGHTLDQPQGIRLHLRGTVGSVADPAFVMRRRISIEPGEQIQLFAITTVADSKEEAISIILRVGTSQAIDRTFQLAWNRSQIELRQQQVSTTDAITFQSLASQLLYASPHKAEKKMAIKQNVKGQSSLWAHGISGDRSIALVRIHNQTDIRFIIKLLSGHEYLRRMGLSFDLVIVNESEEGYQQSLQDALKRVIEHNVNRLGVGPVGIYIINSGQISYEDKTLLFAIARIVLKADGPSLKSQLKVKGTNTIFPEMFEHERVAPTHLMNSSQQADTSDLIFFNGWGGFSPNGKEYRIILKNGNHLPAPWINVIANPQFGCLVSELGTGYTWWRNSREFKLTSWSNDPVLDPPSEICYLRDEQSGDIWSASASSLSTDKAYTVTHGRGFTRIIHERHGIEHEMTITVPLNDSVKLVKLIIRNQTNLIRNISITYYAEWVLGVRRQGSAPLLVTDWESSDHVLLAHNTYQETFRDAHAFLGVYPQDNHAIGQLDSTSSEEGVDVSWTADRTEFIGRNGTLEQPAAMTRSSLSCQTGSFHDCCGAVQAKVTMEPESERTVYILLGCESSRETAINLVRKYSRTNACELALKSVDDYWNETLDQISVVTPCKEMDILLNGWLVYQTLACRMWARSAFYQAGGAFGFRDQLQDSLALLHTKSDLTKRQIQLHASHQFEEGDVQHWWHEETERGIRTLFTDDLLWLPYTVARYVDHSGDIAILEEIEPYLHSEPLNDGEHERYESTIRSTQQGSIYEHCVRAIDRCLQRFGEHGLPLIGVGDWNDGMNLVGAEGRGESVWLGWFLCDVLNPFTDLCLQRGDNDRADHYQQVQEKLKSALDEHAWDGNWYRRAFTDAGSWLGSMHNEECRIDAIAQSWSVISGAGRADKSIKAMESFDQELVDRELDVVRLLTPPFDHTDPSPGYIQGYPPGIRENGAQYTHGAIWSIIAWCKLGNGDKAFELFHILNPISHTRTPHEVKQYVGEPYVMAADVYTEQPHKGRSGWTWYTGAAGWMYQAGVEWILGIRRHGNQLQLKPCIPCEWPEYAVRYRYGKATYAITVLNPHRKSSGASKLRINEQDIILTDNDAKYGPSIELIDHDEEHHIELTL